MISFTHSNVLCDLERFSSVEVLISIEATAVGDYFLPLYGKMHVNA